MECSICCAAEAVTVLRACELQGAVRAGFNPFREKGLIADYIIGLMDPGYPSRWAKSVLKTPDSQGDWPVCEKCRNRIIHYSMRVSTGELRPGRSDGSGRPSSG
jgi:hypothetical protein